MKIIIIGAGVIGCSVARELSRYNADVTVLEAHNDVACGTSKANSGIVHAGFDAKPHTLKAKFNIEGNKMFDEASAELDFPFIKNGACVLCFKKEHLPELSALYERGLENGIQGLELCDKARAKELCPHISDAVVGCIYAPTSGIVDPYNMTIAYAENAFTNGVRFEFECKVKSIEKQNDSWNIKCENNAEFFADMVINCAGVQADVINNWVAPLKMEIIPRKGEYILMDKSEGYLAEKTIFQLPTAYGKGVLVTRTCHGNLLVGPTAIDENDKDNVDTTYDGLKDVFEKGSLSVPLLNRRAIIKQFSGLRAHSVSNDFIIGESAVKGFYNVAGIESPGLTSAPAIGQFVATDIAKRYNLEKNQKFNGKRVGIPRFSELNDQQRQELISKNPLFGKIVCRCETVTEGEIVDSIRRPLGAKDLDGVKRRTRAGMGRCQAGFCTSRTMQILSRELNCPIETVTLSGKGSNIIVGGIKE